MIAPRMKSPGVTSRKDDGDREVWLINARRYNQREDMTRNQVRRPRPTIEPRRKSPQRRVPTPSVEQNHHSIIMQCERRGRSNGMSEIQFGERNQSKMDRKGGIRNNKCGEYDTYIETLPAFVKVIIFRSRRKRFHCSLLSAQQVKDRAEQWSCHRKFGIQQWNFYRNNFKAGMETRKSNRMAEAQLLMDERNRDRKGKMIAKEEVPVEIFEITDNSEDEELKQEIDRKFVAMDKSMGSREKLQAAEEQPPIPVEQVRRYGRGRGTKGMGGRGTGDRGPGSRRDAGMKREWSRSRGGEG